MAAQGLRTPIFLIALAALGIAFLVEIGSNFFPPPKVTRAELARSIAAERRPDDPEPDVDALLAARERNPPRPGMAIPYMAMLDGLLLFTVLLMGVSLVLPERIHGRVQGLATLILTLLVLLAAILLIIAAFTLLLVMFGLFVAVPFGTIAYLAIWGSFDRGGAAATLSIILLLKLVFAMCLLLAQPRFLQNKGLVLLTLTALLGNVVIGFLHGIVPGVMVSITDALAAVIVGVLAALWALFLLVGSVPAVIKAIRLEKQSA